MSEKVWRVE